MCVCVRACVCLYMGGLHVHMYEGRCGIQSSFIPTEVDQFCLYFTYRNLRQQLCVVMMYVDCIKIHKSYFFFYAQLIAAKLCVVRQMYFLYPLFFFLLIFAHFTLCILLM